MNRDVRIGWLEFNKPCEGFTTWMYLDRKGYVTTGVGNLTDTTADARALPWKRQDGSPASPREVDAAWHAVKERQDLRERGGGAFAPLTTIRLSRADVIALVDRRLTEVETRVRTFFPAWAAWPSAAQTCVLSMAWAMGAGRLASFPKFRKAMNAGDWETAIAECKINEPGDAAVALRNAKNEALLASLLSTPDDVA